MLVLLSPTQCHHDVGATVVYIISSRCWCYSHLHNIITMLVLPSPTQYHHDVGATVTYTVSSRCWCYCRLHNIITMLVLLSPTQYHHDVGATVTYTISSRCYCYCHLHNIITMLVLLSSTQYHHDVGATVIYTLSLQVRSPTDGYPSCLRCITNKMNQQRGGHVSPPPGLLNLHRVAGNFRKFGLHARNTELNTRHKTPTQICIIICTILLVFSTRDVQHISH